MALPTPFSAGTTPQVLRASEHHVATPRDGFNHLGALEAVGENEDDFNEFCSAARRIDDAVSGDEELAEDIATLLNRAFAFGLLQGRTGSAA